MRAFILLAITSALLFSVSADAKVLYVRDVPPLGWVRQLDHVNPTMPITFILALRQRNLDDLEKLFWQVSTPDDCTENSMYRRFQSMSDITNLIAPSAVDKQPVLAWLHEHVFLPTDVIIDHGDSLEVFTSIQSASALFNTSFFVYHHEQSGKDLVRQHGKYSVPDYLGEMIQLVVGLSSFPIPHWRAKRAMKKDPDLGICPTTLYNLYNISKQVPHSALNTSQCVIEFEEQYFSPSNLEKYGQMCGIKTSPVSPKHVIGDNQGDEPQLEAELDIQMMASVNIEADNWFWIEGGNSWLYEFAVHMFSTQDVPWVASISYGWSEADQCSINPDECSQIGVDSYGYVNRVNTEFMKIGLRGVSLLSASGDSGVHGRTDPSCTAATFRPDFPGSSPYVTSVGGTELHDATVLKNPPKVCVMAKMDCADGKAGTEEAVSYGVSYYTSGGGFSNVSAMPNYQVDAVTAYLNSKVPLPPQHMYNSSGRGFPDVSAIGHNCLIYSEQQVEPVGGTSCSAPIFGGIVSLLNQIALKKTSKPLGFLNPLLYKMAAESPGTFTDITVGDNKCTEAGCAGTCEGFVAAKGWNPVTGFGSPVYSKMSDYLNTELCTMPQ
jgi:subtilase family serine protease